jgi:hypothetical protein
MKKEGTLRGFRGRWSWIRHPFPTQVRGSNPKSRKVCKIFMILKNWLFRAFRGRWSWIRHPFSTQVRGSNPKSRKVYKISWILKMNYFWVFAALLGVFGVADHEYDIEIFRARFRKRWAWLKFIIFLFRLIWYFYGLIECGEHEKNSFFTLRLRNHYQNIIFSFASSDSSKGKTSNILWWKF